MLSMGSVLARRVAGGAVETLLYKREWTSQADAKNEVAFFARETMAGKQWLYDAVPASCISS